VKNFHKISSGSNHFDGRFKKNCPSLQLNPNRGVIAAFFPATDIAINACGHEAIF
jgi:hypothetical protein